MYGENNKHNIQTNEFRKDINYYQRNKLMKKTVKLSGRLLKKQVKKGITVQKNNQLNVLQVMDE
jgi:hypothetical protein